MAFQVLSELFLQEIQDIAVYSVVWFFIHFVRLFKKYSSNTAAVYKTSLKRFSASILLNYERIIFSEAHLSSERCIHYFFITSENICSF